MNWVSSPWFRSANILIIRNIFFLLEVVINKPFRLAFLVCEFCSRSHYPLFIVACRRLRTKMFFFSVDICLELTARKCLCHPLWAMACQNPFKAVASNMGWIKCWIWHRKCGNTFISTSFWSRNFLFYFWFHFWALLRALCATHIPAYGVTPLFLL